MEIKTVSLIGLGALGVLFGHQLAKHMTEGGDLRVIADRDRIERYKRDKVYSNGETCEFSYHTPDDPIGPADLVLIGVKEKDLKDAIEIAKSQVGEDTIIISMLNGISSEETIGGTFGMEHVVYCVAQEMDALKIGNRMTYMNMGKLVIGELDGSRSERIDRLADFFDRHSFPYEIAENMQHRLWGKFMVNVGVNQTVAVYKGTFSDIQKKGEARDVMIGAMREVMAIAAKENIPLTEKDLRYWLDILDTLNPEGKPSLAQDLEAGRFSEVELFAGTVKKKGVAYGIPTPVNDILYNKIKEIEATFER